AHHPPQPVWTVGSNQLDRVRAPLSAFVRVGIRACTEEQQSAHPFGHKPRQRERAISAHRRADDGKVLVRLGSNRLRPGVHGATAPVQTRRDDVVTLEHGALQHPHPLVERKGVKQENRHRDATTSISAAMDGRSSSLATQSATAEKRFRSTSSRSRARRIQGAYATSASPNSRPLRKGRPCKKPSSSPSATSSRPAAPSSPRRSA